MRGPLFLIYSTFVFDYKIVGRFLRNSGQNFNLDSSHQKSDF